MSRVWPYEQTGKFVDKINLSEMGKDRAYAQALLFGPDKSYQEVVAGGPNLVRCFCGDGSVVEQCATLDCLSSPEVDAVCGPICENRGGEAGTACLGGDPQCAALSQTPAAGAPALGKRQPPGQLGR